MCLKGKCWCCGTKLQPKQEFCEECAIEILLIRSQMPELELAEAAAS
jgi:uncharacterized OB-fold protein